MGAWRQELLRSHLLPGPLIMEDDELEPFDRENPLICNLLNRDDDARATALQEFVAYFTEDPSRVHLRRPTLRYYASEAPVADIRDACHRLLQLDAQIPVSAPSNYVDGSLFNHESTLDDSLQVLSDTFYSGGRITNLDRLMALHADYHLAVRRTNFSLFYESGPLPVPWRLYIVILAAAQLDSHHVVELFIREFREHGGDVQWLRGVQHADPKMQKLLPVLSVLAHEPWLLGPSMLEGILTADGGWSTGEFVHALALIATGNLLGMMASGCGATQEVSLKMFESAAVVEPISLGASMVRQDSSGCPSTPMAEEKYTETRQVAEKLQLGVAKWKEEDDDEGDMMDFFFKSDSLAFSNAAECDEPEDVVPSTPCRHACISGDLTCFVDDSREHRDFDCSSKDYDIYHVEDFPWVDSVVPLLDRYYTGIGTLLDDQSRTIFSLTYNTFRELEGVDTQPFRHAIWFYVQRIAGLFHDDYDYREVNLLVNRDLKNYCKKVTCVPCETTLDDFNNLGVDLSASEKVHVVFVAAESRKKSCLMYGVRALNQFKNSH